MANSAASQMKCDNSKGTHSNGVSEEEIGSSKVGITNGFSQSDKSLQNGSDDAEDHFIQRKRKVIEMTTMEKDIISLIGQHLREKGFSKTLDSLVEESGCSMEHPTAGSFRTHILLGQWNEAVSALEDLSSLLQDPYLVEQMRLLLLEEKFLEHLEKGERMSALQCLRHDLVSLPIHHPGKRVQDLSQYLMCQSKEDLYRLANWPGVNGGARQRLLDTLQVFLPPSIMLPPKRLELLLGQSIQLQVDKCPFHYMKRDISSYSLLANHMCRRCDFPCETVHTLKGHNDEVWFVQFSHSGSHMSSGSKDGTIIVWKTEPSEVPVKLHTAKGQSSGITSILWSPDDSLLLSCGTEDCPEVIVFDSMTGVEKCRVNNSLDDSLTCATWHHSSKKFYVGGLRGQFYECSAEDGSVTNSWEGVRLHAVAAHPYDNVVFAADSHLRIRRYNFENKTSNTLIKEENPIMTFTLSEDARYALLNVASQGVHVWDLVDRCMIKQYQGVTQGYYTIHSCYGINDSFIASGSEDNNVYVWNKKRETPVVILQGHTHTVNSVSWNPVHHSMIASASDDSTIRVWGTEEEMKKQKEQKQKKQRKKEKAASGLEEDSNGNNVVIVTEEEATNNDGQNDDVNNEEAEFEDSLPTGQSEQQQQQRYERLSQPISEMDLQALEMLDPDSSSQEENSNDRLEAAVSLSTLSTVGGLPQSEISLNTRNISRVLASGPSGRGLSSSGMLVIVQSSTQGGYHGGEDEDEAEIDEEDGVESSLQEQQVVSFAPLLSQQPSLEQESRSFDLDSSMESEESTRQLEGDTLITAEGPSAGDSSSITVVTTNPSSGVEPDQQQDDTDGSSVVDDSSNSSNNGTTARTRSRLRDNSNNNSATTATGGGSAGRSIATESSVSTLV